jgi:Tetratricopeptide repeat
LHHLGMVAQDKGDYDGALDWYRKSLAILEQLGNRAGRASSSSQVGVSTCKRGGRPMPFAEPAKPRPGASTCVVLSGLQC